MNYKRNRKTLILVKIFEIRVLISKYECLQDNLISFSSNFNTSKYIPTIIAITSGWKGFLQIFCNEEDFHDLLVNPLPLDLHSPKINTYEKEGTFLSNCLLSTLISVECIKLCLNVGTRLDKPLYFNLLSMNFYKSDNKNFTFAITNFLNNNYSENGLPYNLKEIK